MASAGAIRAGEAFVELNGDDSKLRGILAGAVARIRKTGETLRQAGGKATLAGIGLGAGLTPATRSFVGFDDAIRAAGARAEASSADLAAMRERALELGQTTSFTATEIATLMGELGTAGFRPDQINTMTAAVLDLARASGTDAAQSAKILGATLNQYGIEAAGAARVTDLLTATANKSATTLAGLGETMQYVGPAARDLGISLEDSLALAGALGNVGIEGSEAGTALRRLGVLVASGGKDINRLFGVANADAAGNARPLIDVLDDIQESMKGLSDTEKTSKMSEFFGLLGITSASSLGKNAVSVRKLRAELDGADGSAKKVAAEMDAGLGGALRRVLGAAEGAAIAFGQAMAPALGAVALALTGLARMFSAWVKDNEAVAMAVVGLVVALVLGGVALTALGVVLGFVARSLSFVAGGFGLVRLAVLGVAAVTTIATTAFVVCRGVVMGLRAAAFAIIGAFAAVKAGLLGISLVAGVTTAALTVCKVVTLALAAVASLPFLIMGGLALVVVAAVAGLVGAFRAAFRAFGDTFGRIGTVASTVIKGVVDAFKRGDMEAAWGIATTGLRIGWELLILGLKRGWNAFTNYFGDRFRSAWVGIRDFAFGIVAEIRILFLEAIVEILDKVNDVAARIKRLAPGAPEEKVVAEKANASPEGKAVAAEIEANRARRFKEDDKRKDVQKYRDEAKTPEGKASYDEILKTIDARIAELKAEKEALAKQWDRVVTKVRADEKWVDTSPFTQAIDDIKNERDKDAEKRKADMAEEIRLRNEMQEAGFAGDKAKIKELEEELARKIAAVPARLAEASGAIAGGVGASFGGKPVPERAPFTAPTDRLGDAVRGLFQSADYRGALGMSSSIPQQQLDATKEMGKKLDVLGDAVAVLKEIERKTGVMVFT